MCYCDTVYGSKEDFRVPYGVTSFENQNHYIVLNLIAVVQSVAETTWNSKF